MNKLERVMQFTFRQDKECIMPVTTSNTYGKISISDEAIAKVAAHAALECYGIVEMVPRTFMDSFSQLLKKETGGKGVKVVTSGDRIYIDIFVIIKFGVSICDYIIIGMNDAYKVEQFTGMIVDTVNVNILGVKL